MSPVSSATGMNSIGPTIPRRGWCHRSRASTPATWPVPRFMIGWY